MRHAGSALPPPLKWAGGKRWQVPALAPMWAPHSHRRLVEPFCGGLAVSLGLRPERALLNDLNPHLINFYRWLKRGLAIDVRMDNDRALYNRHRHRFNMLLADGRGESQEAAALFYFLNRTGYNGLCRFNSSGAFNVPFGQYTRVPYRFEFSPYREVLARWRFLSRDIGEVPFERADFIYADPPYDVQFTQYSPVRFRWSDQVRTAELLAKHPGPVVLVNQATERIIALYESLGYTLRFLQAPRRISCTGDRKPVREVLATRNID